MNEDAWLDPSDKPQMGWYVNRSIVKWIVATYLLMLDVFKILNVLKRNKSLI